MVSWFQKIPSENESRAKGENDEMTIPSRLNDFSEKLFCRNAGLKIYFLGSLQNNKGMDTLL